MIETPVVETKGPERPWLFGFLIAPSAVVANGVIQGGVLAYLLSQQGVGSGMQSKLIFWLALPTSLYFLWSPITDFFVRRRTWLLLGGTLAAVMMALAFRQQHLSSATSLALMLLSACCGQLVVSSCGGMMGALRTESAKQTASSFYQAGSMGFGALAASALVYESSRQPQAVLGLLAAAMIFVPVLFAFLAPRQDEIEKGSFAETLKLIGSECKATFWRREALPYIACMTFPMASGAAVGLLPGVANLYHVSGDSVAWLNGLLGGLLVAAGAGAMSLVRTRMSAAVLYMVVALVNCAALSVLWLGPMRPATYFAGVPLYVFTTGCCYAVFTMVVLEFLGQSGKSGGMRYSLINGLGNVPVLYMIRVDGWGGEKWLGRGVAGAEAVVGGVGAAILLVWLLSMGRGKAAEVEAV